MEPWWALCLSILSPIYLSPDAAYESLEKGEIIQYRARKKNILDREDVAGMLRLKATMTYRQVREIYGLTADVVYTRIRRFQGRIR